MICTSLHLYLQHENGAGTLYRYAVPACTVRKSTGIVAKAVADVTAALLTSGEGKDRSFNKITEKLSVSRYRARQLYKNISMLFLFPVSDVI